MAQLGELKKITADPSRPDVQILAISIDARQELQGMYKTISKDGEPKGFLFLSDPEHKVISRYGILNESSKNLPHPATYVIDRNGVVRWKSLEVDYRLRPTNGQILKALESLR